MLVFHHDIDHAQYAHLSTLEASELRLDKTFGRIMEHEANPVIKALQHSGLEVVVLHNHMLGDARA